MKRLTKKIDNGRFVTTDAEARSYGETDPEDGFFYNYFTGEAVDKLAAYEDTGLEPADIEELLARNDKQKMMIRKQSERTKELLATVPHWISVEERLPEIGEIVLAYVDELGLIIRAKIVDAKDYRGERRIDWARVDKDPFFLSCYTVTHWMPLPKAPKEVK